MKWSFTSISDINWSKMWMVVGTIAMIWSGLAAVSVMYPECDKIYKLVNIILAAVQGGFLFAARSSKYAKTNTEPPADGKP